MEFRFPEDYFEKFFVPVTKEYIKARPTFFNKKLLRKGKDGEDDVYNTNVLGSDVYKAISDFLEKPDFEILEYIGTQNINRSETTIRRILSKKKDYKKGYPLEKMDLICSYLNKKVQTNLFEFFNINSTSELEKFVAPYSKKKFQNIKNCDDVLNLYKKPKLVPDKIKERIKSMKIDHLEVISKEEQDLSKRKNKDTDNSDNEFKSSNILFIWTILGTALFLVILGALGVFKGSAKKTNEYDTIIQTILTNIQNAINEEDNTSIEYNIKNAISTNLAWYRKEITEANRARGKLYFMLSLVIKNKDFFHKNIKDKFVLENIDFYGMSLKDMSFYGSRLKGANFGNTNLSRIDFSSADLTETNFSQHKSNHCNFGMALCWKTIFKNSIILNTKFEQAIIIDTDFSDSVLENVNFKYCNIEALRNNSLRHIPQIKKIPKYNIRGIFSLAELHTDILFTNSILKACQFDASALGYSSFENTIIFTMPKLFFIISGCNFKGARFVGLINPNMVKLGFARIDNTIFDNICMIDPRKINIRIYDYHGKGLRSVQWHSFSCSEELFHLNYDLSNATYAPRTFNNYNINKYYIQNKIKFKDPINIKDSIPFITLERKK